MSALGNKGSKSRVLLRSNFSERMIGGKRHEFGAKKTDSEVSRHRWNSRLKTNDFAIGRFQSGF